MCLSRSRQIRAPLGQGSVSASCISAERLVVDRRMRSADSHYSISTASSGSSAFVLEVFELVPSRAGGGSLCIAGGSSAAAVTSRASLPVAVSLKDDCNAWTTDAILLLVLGGLQNLLPSRWSERIPASAHSGHFGRAVQSLAR